MDTKRAYAALGLREGAGEDEIKQAYRALAQKFDPENYEAGPLREDAERKMNEINEAFDTLMSLHRTGGAPQGQTDGYAQGYAQGPAAGPRMDESRAAQYRVIRQMINSGDIDNALARLSTIQNGSTDAEWNFLMGSAYYYKGWVAQALNYFQAACRLDPSNPEYTAALRNLQRSAGGAMPGNPYGNNAPYGAQTVTCSCCDMCAAMACMDMCCNCGGGC